MSTAASDTPLLTPSRQKKLVRQQAIYDRYMALIAVPGSMKTACEAVVMEEFEIANRVTVYETVNRVKARMQAEVALEITPVTQS